MSLHLGAYRTTPLPVVHGLDPLSISMLFSLFLFVAFVASKHKRLTDYPGLPAANICNLDETNQTPERRKSRVLAARGARRTHTLHNDARFSMACFHDIFAMDGSFMPPHFIIKGKRRPHWFEENFLPITGSRRSATTPVILILDNFNGHVHPATLQNAKDNNVVMVGLYTWDAPGHRPVLESIHQGLAGT
mmetsp:Transcript_18423/g.51632  ORF Transcript_18423/g.51632 Transcript_18423/m.51632 type:complete len:191 (-) Transcript_18423:38-610(-)